MQKNYAAWACGSRQLHAHDPISVPLIERCCSGTQLSYAPEAGTDRLAG